MACNCRSTEDASPSDISTAPEASNAEAWSRVPVGTLRPDTDPGGASHSCSEVPAGGEARNRQLNPRQLALACSFACSARRNAPRTGASPIGPQGLGTYQRQDAPVQPLLPTRVFSMSAQVASRCHPASKACYDRKRAENKTHKQAVVVLARRSLNVLWALIRDGCTFEITLATQPAAVS